MTKPSLLSKVASKCETCQGAGVLPGRLPDTALLPCPTCKSTGVLVTTKKNKRVEEKPCDNPNCKNGKVRVLEMVDGHDEYVEKTCPVCDGYGVIYKEIVETTTETKTCPSCGGDGKITALAMRERKLEGLCPDCHGTGVRVEKEPADKMKSFGIFSVLMAPLAIVSLAFKFMVSSVKIVAQNWLGKKKEKKN